MTHTSEAAIQRRTIAHARKCGVPVLRLCLLPGIAAGYPDALCILPQMRVAWIEFKAPGKRPTRLQLARHAALCKAGHRVFVVDSVEKGLAAVLLMLRVGAHVKAKKRALRR